MLAGKTVLMTGATGALGHAVSLAFLDAEAKLALTYRDKSKLDELLSALGHPQGILPVMADVSVEADVQNVVSVTLGRLGGIDILVNLVGGYWGGVPVAQTSVADWQRMFDVNLKSCFLCCRAVLPDMLERYVYRGSRDASSAWQRGLVSRGPPGTRPIRRPRRGSSF